MTKAIQEENFPPKLRKAANGDLDVGSLAALLEWFLIFDPRVALVRHPHVEELFQWKQADDAAQGAEVYPFGNAESRFAIGVFQALGENDAEAKLQLYISECLQALGEAKQTNEEIAVSRGFESGKSHVEQAQAIDDELERKIYLTSCWIESLSTAEVRFLGWVFQEVYGKPFQPIG
ncbi:MAG TPA: hypothetical protein VF692_12085 [Pyrinomonadaceae bacterium]|jgi:hypothetical protein